MFKYYQILSKYTDKCLLFPMDDFLTSEALAVSPELKTNRLETLKNLSDGNKIIVTNLMGFLRYLPTKEIYNNSCLKIDKESEYNIKTEKWMEIKAKKKHIIKSKIIYSYYLL